MFTIDASVWVNADSPAEPGQADSRALPVALATRQVPIIVPTLLIVEAAGAIARTRGDAQLAEQFASSLFALPHIQWVALDQSLSHQAMTVAAHFALRGADAVYASVAMTHNCELVSLDREHLTRLPDVVRTSTPRDALARLTGLQRP